MPRHHFTHLLPPDAELLSSFLHANPDRYSSLDFDVKVGQGNDPGPDIPDNYRKMAINLSQRRIDAVGFRSSSIDIIEVTLTAGLTSLGQLLSYPHLYQSTYHPSLPLNPVLVTYAFSADMQPLYTLHHIEFFVMPRP